MFGFLFRSGSSGTFWKGITIFALLQKSVRTTLLGLMTLGLALSTIGAVNPPTAPPGACLTQAIRISLAGEQVSFCAPANLPYTVVEDSTSDASVNYAGLAQLDGYGIVNIKATAPGNAPGIGRPVYTLDDAVAYRQAVWNQEIVKTDRNVSNGPTGLFWNETIQGIQEDLSLTTSAGNLQVRSIEWYVTHDNRLWSFIITWNTEMQNASEWEAASRNILVQKPESENLADTAIDLGTAFLENQSAGEISIMGAPVDVGAPSWWSGKCDDTNYYAHTTPHTHSTVLAKWHGVSACGPVGGPDYAVQFFPGAWGEYEFECVELVMRFLYLEWGIAPWGGNANQIAYSPHLPNSLVFYPNDGSRGIVPGDIITENASTQNSAGHTAVVTGISLNGTGTGTIRILEQKASSSGQRSLNVQNWQVQPDTWAWGQTIQGWLHVKGNQDDGNQDPLFTPGTGADGRVNAIAIKPGGKILIAGNFSNYNGSPVNHFTRLYADGTLDTTFNPVGVAMTGDTPHVYALALYSDGRILIGGHFDSYNGTPRKYIARLNSNGSLDTTFTPPSDINADVYKIVIVNPADTTSKILVGGAGLLFRLKNSGARDTKFAASTNNSVRDIAVQSLDGTIYIGGDFSKADGVSRAGVARLNNDGKLDQSFDPGTGTGTDAVASISLDPDGRLLIGGNFTAYNGAFRNKVARLNSDGSLDASFNPGTGISGSSDYVQTILSQTDGRILIGGNFSIYNGETLNNIGRLNYNGSRDTTFFGSLDGLVQTLILQPDGKMLLGGNFTHRVARLLNHIESCYTLTTLATPADGGSLTVDPPSNCPGGKYLSGTSMQVTVVLNPDYWLANWSGDASGNANPLSLTMKKNMAVTANLMASPGHFNKLSPGDGTSDVPANATLSWETSTDATSYKYCLDMTDNDTCDSGTWVSTGTNTSVSLSNLLPSTTYYWQVRAKNQVDTTDATGGWWFFTRDGIPAIPVTISPNGIIIDTQPAYVWNESNGAISYHVTVYSFSASANVIDDNNVLASVCSGGVCTYHPALELQLGNYEFQVFASATGTSDPSPWRTFSVGLGVFLPLIVSHH
jgi:uncharacterized delta-60 repeat protein